MGFYQESEAPDPVIQENDDGSETWRYRDGRVYQLNTDGTTTKIEFNPPQNPADCYTAVDVLKERYKNRPDAYNVPESFGDVPTFDCFDLETRLKIRTAIENYYCGIDDEIVDTEFKTLLSVKP